MPKVTKNPELLLKENNELQAFLNDRKVPHDAKHNFTHTDIYFKLSLTCRIETK